MQMAYSRRVTLLPLSLNVNSDNNAANYGRRFNLNANNEPHNVAPMALVLSPGFKVITWKPILICILNFALMIILS